MEASNRPAVWLPGAVISQGLQWITPEYFGHSVEKQWKNLATAAYWSVFMLSMAWLKLVSENVPEAYLDEIFHVPQAQLYCRGQYDYWDPKLTTPPGLYIFATVFSKLRLSACTISDLRLFNATILPVTMVIALSCRHLIRNRQSTISSDTIHTAVNIALFPPLFFFSGLFYTDLLSTCLVLVTYRLFLRSERGNNWVIFPAGIVGLFMRQTNIFWVAAFLGGLETVRSLSAEPFPTKDDQIAPGPWKERVRFEIAKWARGNIHDVNLSEAGLIDYLLCVISIATAAINRPAQLVYRLLPYLALLLSFAFFVIWNGGVVLGDKSNHIATIHLPQLLYLFAFTTFFSLPLMITPILAFVKSLVTLLGLPGFPRLRTQYVLVSLYTISALVLILGIIKYNTITHPFTLADNRHYVFYVFRYTILRHPMIRFLLAPIYLACAWAAYLTLCSPSKIVIFRLKESTQVEIKSPKASLRSTTKETEKQSKSTDDKGPKTSFLIIFLLATSLSLVTAPLVEPRYFIIPWVIWRLHVPPLPPRSLPSEPTRGYTATMKFWIYQNHDYRLWLETLYFLAINAVTGYIFLYRGFSWPQEPGKVQRFMW